MSDILQDQKIHLIVKDYKRMYEQHEQLVAIGKELQANLIAKDKELLKVRTEFNNFKAKANPDNSEKKHIKVQVSELEARTISAYNNVQKLENTLTGIMDNIKAIKQILKEQ